MCSERCGKDSPGDLDKPSRALASMQPGCGRFVSSHFIDSAQGLLMFLSAWERFVAQ